MRKLSLTLLTCLLFLSPNVVLSHTPDFIEYIKTYFGGETETVELNTLVNRKGFFYKKFSDVPFSGKTTGQEQGTLKNGKWDGSYVSYHNNGQLLQKGNFKNGKFDGVWVDYNENGTLLKSLTGTYKNGKKISN